MKTWLDAFVVELNNRYALKNDSYYGSRSIIANAHSQLYVGSKWNETFEDSEKDRQKKKEAFSPELLHDYLSISEDERKTLYALTIAMEKEWFALLTPFFREGPYAPLAILLTPELADTLSGKRVAGWDSETFELLERHKSIYIDLPPRLFLIGSHLHIRALFIRDMRHGVEAYTNEDQRYTWRYIEDANAFIRVCAVLSPLGSDREKGRIHWTLSSDEHPIGFTFDDETFDPGVFKLELEEFIKLILAYYLITPIQSQSQLPQIDLDNADRKERRTWERDRKLTLFGVTKLSLTPKQDIFEYSALLRGSRKGWKLGRRIHIAPFPRMQWKGTKEARYQEQVMVGEQDGGYWKGPKNAPLKLKLFALI